MVLLFLATPRRCSRKPATKRASVAPQALLTLVRLPLSAARSYRNALFSPSVGGFDTVCHNQRLVYLHTLTDTDLAIQTVSTMMTTMVCVVRDPIVQARVQAELDIVVGKDRLPTFSDREKLPYLHCVITEAIRYASTTPVGVPHRLMEDDEYNGYFIPKGTMVMANTWYAFLPFPYLPLPHTTISSTLTMRILWVCPGRC